MRLFRGMRRVFHSGDYYIRGVVRGFMTRDVFLWSGAIAFKVLITLVPLVILAAGIFGIVLRRDTVRQTIHDFVAAFAPEAQSNQFADFLLSFSSKGDTLTIIGAGILFVTVITLFSTLRRVIGNIFEGTHSRRHVLKGYGLDVLLAIMGGSLFVLTFGSSLLLDVVDASYSEMIASLDDRWQWVARLWDDVGNLIELLVPLLLSTILFFGLYSLIPLPHPRSRSALIGALTSAILWELAKRVFSFYIVEFGTFERYSGIGTLGLIVGLVFWTYYSGLVFIIGGMVTALHGERRYPVKPSPSNGKASINDVPGSLDEDRQKTRNISANVEGM